MTASDQPTTLGGLASPAAPGSLGAWNGDRALLWFVLALIVAALLLVGLGEGGQRAVGPPPVTVGTAAYHGDAA